MLQRQEIQSIARKIMRVTGAIMAIGVEIFPMTPLRARHSELYEYQRQNN